MRGIMTQVTNYIYVIVRSDIEKQNQIAQACHAAVLAGNKFNQPDEVPNIVILNSKNEDDLTLLCYELNEQGIEFESFYETEFPIGLNSICTEPISGNKRKIFKKYKLWN